MLRGNFVMQSGEIASCTTGGSRLDERQCHPVFCAVGVNQREMAPMDAATDAIVFNTVLTPSVATAAG